MHVTKSAGKYVQEPPENVIVGDAQLCIMLLMVVIIFMIVYKYNRMGGVITTGCTYVQ